MRFFERYSVQGFSDDAIIKLENGKRIRFHDIKVKKIRDLADEFVPEKSKFDNNDTMVGNGFTITYDMLENLEKKPTKKQNGGWKSKIGF